MIWFALHSIRVLNNHESRFKSTVSLYDVHFPRADA